MGKSSITIAVNAQWNGKQLERAEFAMKRLAVQAAAIGDSTSSELAKQGAKWGELGGKIYNAGSKMEKVGTTLTKSLTVPLVAIGTVAGTTAVEFDTALGNVRKTADMSEQELQKLGDAAIELSKTQPVSAEAILNIEALGAQLGVSNSNLQSFAETVSGLDIATDLDADTAATQMAQFANIVGMSEDEFSNYGSTLVDLGNHLATTESSISTMSLRLAGLTSTANFSSADILGLAGAMSSLGINAEAGGSAMTQIVSNITKAVAEGGDAVSEYARVSGVSAEEFCAAWESDPMSVIENLVQGIHDLDEAGTATDTTLASLGITSIRQSDVMRRLSGNTDTLTEAVDRANSAWDSNSALTNEVDKRNETLEARIEVLKNKLEAIAITIGRPLVEALIDAADSMQPLIDTIAGAADAFANADTSTQQLILSIAGIATAAGPVLTVLGKITKGVGTAVTAFGSVQQSLAVYSDSLNTVDGSQMRIYSSADTMASKLGLAKNSAAEAAGSVEAYIEAWEGMTDAGARYEDAIKKLNSAERERESMGTAVTKAEKKKKAALADTVEAMTKESEAAKKSYTENANLVTAWSGSADEAKTAARGMQELEETIEDTSSTAKGATSTTKGLGSTFKSLAGSIGSSIASFAAAAVPMLAVTAAVSLAVAAYQDYASRAEEARQHQENLTKAAQSAESIMAGAATSVAQLGSAIADVSVDADSTTQKIIDLNESVGDTFQTVYNDSAKLDEYVSVIDELANKSNLSATEQYRLKEAVEGYNDVCGTSYQVTDAANGKIADGNGVIQENTTQLDENAQAWKRNAEAQAYASAAAQYLEARVEAEGKLQLATEKYNSLQQERNELLQKEREYTQKVNDGDESYRSKLEEVADQLTTNKQEMDEYSDKIEELQTDYDSAAEKEAYFTTQAAANMAGLDEATSAAAGSIAASLTGMGDDITGALSGAGIDITDLSVKMAEAGVSADSLKNISTSDFAEMVSSCNGDIDSLVAKIVEYNNTHTEDKDSTVTADGNVIDGSAKTAMEDTERTKQSQQDKTTSSNVTGNTVDGTAEFEISETEGIKQKQADKTTSSNVTGNTIDGSASNLLKGIQDRIAALADKTVTVTTRNVTYNDVYSRVFKTESHINGANADWATGGIRTHADGGIRYHANGGSIVNNPGPGVPLDIVGEAGAEAIVPLTNRRYAMPFVKMIAGEIEKQGGAGNSTTVNNYSLNIDGIGTNGSARAQELLQALFREFNLTADMGVK